MLNDKNQIQDGVERAREKRGGRTTETHKQRQRPSDWIFVAFGFGWLFYFVFVFFVSFSFDVISFLTPPVLGSLCNDKEVFRCCYIAFLLLFRSFACYLIFQPFISMILIVSSKRIDVCNSTTKSCSGIWHCGSIRDSLLKFRYTLYWFESNNITLKIRWQWIILAS